MKWDDMVKVRRWARSNAAALRRLYEFGDGEGGAIWRAIIEEAGLPKPSYIDFPRSAGEHS